MSLISLPPLALPSSGSCGRRPSRPLSPFFASSRCCETDSKGCPGYDQPLPRLSPFLRHSGDGPRPNRSPHHRRGGNLFPPTGARTPAAGVKLTVPPVSSGSAAASHDARRRPAGAGSTTTDLLTLADAADSRGRAFWLAAATGQRGERSPNPAAPWRRVRARLRADHQEGGDHRGD